MKDNQIQGRRLPRLLCLQSEQNDGKSHPFQHLVSVSVWTMPHYFFFFFLQVHWRTGSLTLNLTPDKEPFPSGKLPALTSHSKSTLKGTLGSRELYMFSSFNQLSDFGWSFVKAFFLLLQFHYVNKQRVSLHNTDDEFSLADSVMTIFMV